MSILEAKTLTEERAGVLNEIKELSSVVQRDNRSFTADELTKFDALEAREKDLTGKLETVRRLERSSSLVMPAKTDVPYTVTTSYKNQITRADRTNAFKAWSLQQAGQRQHISRAMRDAADKCEVNIDQGNYNVKLSDNGYQEIQRDQAVGTASEGGNLTNDSLFQGLERNLKYFGGVRSLAKVIRTETGETYHWAYSDDTTNVATIQSTENTTVNNTSVTYSRKSVGAFTYNTGVYPVSVQLLQDSRIDVGADVGECLGVRLGRGTAADYSQGVGTTAPTGYLVDGTVGTTTASPTAITYSELVDFYHKLDVAYRNDPSTAFVMHDATVAYLQKLVDSTGRPLLWNFQSNLSSGWNLTLFGKPIVIDNTLPTIAATHKVIAFGAWNKFVIRDAGDVNLIVLRERFMDTLSVGYLAYMRTDCKLLNPNTVQILQMHA